MFALVFKDAAPAKNMKKIRHDATVKAWLSRTRAIHHGGKDVGWLDEHGKPVGEDIKKAMSRLQGAIPPGWTNVRITTDPNDYKIVTGTAANGQSQRLYTKEHAAEADIRKYSRVSQLHPYVGKIMQLSQSDMMNEKLTDKQRDVAATLNLVAKTAFRPGSKKDTGAKEQAYGASTLEKRHIKVTGNAINFTFVAKHAVQQNKTLIDDSIATYLNGKLKGLKDGDRVFRASAEDVGDYLKKITGKAFQTKDLRTWNGTTLAKHEIKKLPHPKNEAELKAMKKAVSTTVSEHLGNRPEQALKSYINPIVWPIPKDATTAITKASKKK